MGDGGITFELDLEKIRWSAKTIHDHFGEEETPGPSVFETACQLLQGKHRLDSLPSLDIIAYEGNFYTSNNRLVPEVHHRN